MTYEERVEQAANIFMSHLPNNNRPTSDEDRSITREILAAAGFTKESVAHDAAANELVGSISLGIAQLRAGHGWR